MDIAPSAIVNGSPGDYRTRTVMIQANIRAEPSAVVP
jgi:hypothetical protein